MTIRAGYADCDCFPIHKLGSVAVHSSLPQFLKPDRRASCDLTIAIKPAKERNQLDEGVDGCFRMMGRPSSAGAMGPGLNSPDQYQSLIDVALGVVHPIS